MVFEAFYTRRGLRDLALAAFLFAALGVCVIVVAIARVQASYPFEIGALAFLLGTTQRQVEIALGCLAVLMVVAAVPIITSSRKHVGPAIRIDSLGIRWHRWSADPILWAHVSRIETYRLKNSYFLRITLSPAYLDRPRTILGLMSRVNRISGFGDVALNLNGTDGRFDDMVKAARFYHPSQSD